MTAGMGPTTIPPEEKEEMPSALVPPPRARPAPSRLLAARAAPQAQGPPTGQNLGKRYLLLYSYDLCGFVVSPSMGLVLRWPPACQDFDE